MNIQKTAEISALRKNKAVDFCTSKITFAEMRDILGTNPINFFYKEEIDKLNWDPDYKKVDEPGSIWNDYTETDLITAIAVDIEFYIVKLNNMNIGYKVLNYQYSQFYGRRFYDKDGNRITEAVLYDIAKALGITFNDHKGYNEGEQ